MRRPLQQLHAWGTHLWETTQVELHGHYSIEQLQRFEQYRASTSWGRALLVCILTPLPCVILMVLLDLLPLEPISQGTYGSPRVWFREFTMVVLISLCTLEQVRVHVPQLNLHRPLLVFISLVASVTGVASAFGLSTRIGYPFPFTVIVGMVPWFLMLCILSVVFRCRYLQTECGLAVKVWRYLLVLICQVVMTIVYPLYNYFYKGMSSINQTAFVLLLPVVKIAMRNWISRALPDVDDAKPETVVFNIEIFHSLFVSLCMGSTTSGRTVAALMAVDFIQAWLSFTDLRVVLNELKPIAIKLDAARQRTESVVSTSRQSLQYLVSISNRIVEYEPSQAQPGGKRYQRNPVIGTEAKWSSAASVTWQLVKSFKSRRSIRPASEQQSNLTSIVLPTTQTGWDKSARIVSLAPEPPIASSPTLPSDLACLTVVERGILVRQTQRLLYITEFLVLVEYTEVIMPVIYQTVVLSMYHLPNRQYYTFLEGICTIDGLYGVLQSVWLYSLLEFFSLLLMAAATWWMIRLSLVHQLAFVLQNRSMNIQAKLLMWVVYALQSSIVQLGPDYSFRFDWLNDDPGRSPPTLNPNVLCEGLPE